MATASGWEKTGKAKPKLARNSPVKSVRKAARHRSATDTEDLSKIGQARGATLPAGDGELVLDSVETIRGIDFKSHAEELAFMEEMVTVLVHNTPDKNEPPVFQVFNDGRPQAFVRGREQQVRRKYVEVLARARPTSFTTDIETNTGTGDVTQRLNARTGLLYPFSVVRDDNPRGRAWLDSILHSA